MILYTFRYTHTHTCIYMPYTKQRTMNVRDQLQTPNRLQSSELCSQRLYFCTARRVLVGQSLCKRFASMYVVWTVPADAAATAFSLRPPSAFAESRAAFFWPSFPHRRFNK